ncbi:MAG TPA: DUF3106 domain-containing protein [Burkholderiaceae bacterium]|nr:DUF3106 domain-containing protein [Burkholderiaceae bacterium]
MKPEAPGSPTPLRRITLRTVVLACALGAPLGLIAAGSSLAQPGGPPAAKPGVEEGVRWQELKPAQREALKPLEREWSGIDKVRKQKWIEISSRYSKMSPDQQARLQDRMTEWAKLSPQERGAARLHFQEAKQLAPQDRKARWDAYQALPPEKRRELSERAVPPPEAARKSPAGRNGDTKAAARDVPSPKSNIVPNPAFADPPKPVAPTVLRAGPGATTTLITKRPAPPSHQQTGLPKIAATPEFVDKSTLLPRRGPQAAATVPRSVAAASAPGADAAKRR